jgi:hypothetical protein
MTELDIALAATYLKRVTLSSSALDELIEEENTRKIRRVVSSNGLMQSSPRSGLLAEEAPRKLKPDDGELRRVVSAEEMIEMGASAAALESLGGGPSLSTEKRDESARAVSEGDDDAQIGARGSDETLETFVKDLEDQGSLGPVEIGRCREIAATADDFVKRGLNDALGSAVLEGDFRDLGDIVGIHRRSRPYDLRDDLRRAVAFTKQRAIDFRLAERTDDALEAMRELKKLQWQLDQLF